MNKPILIIAAIMTTLIVAGAYLINTNPNAKALAQKYGIIDAPQTASVPPVSNSVFIIFDPSGSGHTSYSVPQIDTNYINQVTSKIQSNGSGDVWLTYIDMNGNNNDVLHLSIPKSITGIERPVRKSGERKGDYDKRLATFMQDSSARAEEIAAYWKTYKSEKENFITDCQEMIASGYEPKKPGTDYSDCIGSINAALRSLKTVQHDSLHFRCILFISDGVQDLPSGETMQKIDSIPNDIQVITVNHSGSKENVLHGHTIEVDNLDRAMQYVIHSIKPLNQ